MPKVKVFNMKGEQVGDLDLNEAVFGASVNETVLHSAVVTYLANQRQGTQSTLTRAEVSGGGKKPWRQKGTGRARQGSTRAPQWTHGGIALGPKPRLYKKSMNKKVRRNAMISALSSKVVDEKLIVVDNITMDAYKTKTVVEMLKALNANKSLIVTAEKNEFVIKSAANLPGVATALTNTVNVYDILKYDSLILSKDAVAKLEEVYA
ncbi:MAG: 50S ribosomal protein L4 [Clostridia bacterium]|nr:50S ribosomal protein L4 [Clostridia bacterium]